MLSEIKKLYKNYFVKVMIAGLLLVAVLEPVCIYVECIYSKNFSSNIGTNAFQFWILMNSSGWGHAILFMFFWVFPILSTGFVFFYERSGSFFETAICKVSRKKYFRTKVLSLFVVTFTNWLAILFVNLLIVYILFDTNNKTEQFFYCVPQSGTFAAGLYEISPLIMGIVYCVLYALVQAVLSLVVFAIQMIGKFKKIYLAFAVPFSILYVLEYLIGILCAKYEMNAYNPLIFVQPRAANALVELITWKNIFVTMGIILMMTILLFLYGAKRNEDVL